MEYNLDTTIKDLYDWGKSQFELPIAYIMPEWKPLAKY